MTPIIERLSEPTTWPASVYFVLLSGLVTFVYQILVRPTISEKAPRFFSEDDWPFLGALRFFSARHDYMMAGIKASQHGSFSFYVGKKHVVGLGGVEGRKTFYDTRELDINAG
jgi:hypothetical protein